MESAPCDGGGVGLELAPSYYARLSSAAGGGIGTVRNRWLSSMIIGCVASRLFSSVFRKPLVLSGTNQMAKFLQANRIAFFKTLDEAVNFSRRILASQAPTLQSDMNHFGLDYCPSGEPALRVSELAIDEKLKSGAFSAFTTGKVASPIIHTKWNERKPSTSLLLLFCRRSPSCSHPLREAHSYPHSYAKVSFLSSLPFCDRSFSQNHLDLLYKEFSLSRRWCHTSKSHTQCWSCGKAAASWPFLACVVCRSVQPMDPSVDYFQIFGLERTYEIKDTNLEGKYKNWQKKLHPDLVHSKSEKERAFAAEQSARVIDAYRTLSKPVSRALYLLQLEGIHVDEEKTLTNPDVLTEMMEIREAVEEAGDSDTLKQIQSQIQNKLDNWSSAFREAFEKRNFEDAITSVQRMRYYDRAIEAIVKKL